MSRLRDWSDSGVWQGFSQGFRPLVSAEPYPYLWSVGNGRMVVIVAIIVPHSSIPKPFLNPVSANQHS